MASFLSLSLLDASLDKLDPSRPCGGRVLQSQESLVSVCIAVRCPCTRFLTTLPTCRLQICLGLPYDISAYITFFACLLSSFYFSSLLFHSVNTVDNSMSLSWDYAATAFNGEQGTTCFCFFYSMLLTFITASI